MAPSPQRGSESVSLSGGALGELRFDWSGDRYQHKWLMAESQIEIASVESPSTEPWPVNPPLQQIHQQSFGDGREVIFGVGMAGRGHWSASYTLVPELKCWIVELACRSPIQPERLLSTYTLDPAWQAESALRYFVQLDNSRIVLEAIAPSAVAEHEAETIRFFPAKLGQGASTTQWAFRLRVD